MSRDKDISNMIKMLLMLKILGVINNDEMMKLFFDYKKGK